jgi:multidrug resistance efflux pump
MKGRSRVLTWSLPILGVGALLAGAGMVAQNRPVRLEESPPRPPATAPAVSADIDATRFIGAIGVSEPPGEAIEIGAQVGGIVTAVAVDLGDTVAAGDVLLTVDDRAAASAVALRRSQVAVAEAELARRRTEVPVRRADVRTAEAQLASARAAVTAAEADLADRRNQLRIVQAVDDPRAIAAEEIDRRRFAVDQAAARLGTAQAGVAEAEAGLTRRQADLEQLVDPATGADGAELRALSRRIEQARREVEQAEVDQQLRTVRSPVDGRVLQVNIRPGEYAAATTLSEGLIVLGRGGGTHLRVEIDEVDIPRFRPGARAWATARGDAGNRISLELVLVEPLVVPKGNLAGRSRDVVDTRVMQVVYRLVGEPANAALGRQFDVFIEANPAGNGGGA